jgi:hypothetical protein
VKTIIEQKTKKRAEQKQRPSEQNEEEDNKEQRDLLDIMMDCQNEDGAVLSHSELADQTKT